MDPDRQLTSRSTTNQMIARTLCDPFSCLMASFKVGTDTLNCEHRIKRASLCNSIAFNEQERCCKQRARILTSLSQPRCQLKKTKRPMLLQYDRLLLTQSLECLVSRIADNWHLSFFSLLSNFVCAEQNLSISQVHTVRIERLTLVLHWECLFSCEHQTRNKLDHRLLEG